MDAATLGQITEAVLSHQVFQDRVATLTSQQLDALTQGPAFQMALSNTVTSNISTTVQSPDFTNQLAASIVPNVLHLMESRLAQADEVASKTLADTQTRIDVIKQALDQTQAHAAEAV